MEPDFPPLDFDAIVSHLIQVFEVAVRELTLESGRDFPALFCRELAFYTHGQIQLMLMGRNDLRGEQIPLNKRSFKTTVQGERTYGMLVLLFAPQEADAWHVAVKHTEMLARVCGLLLWMFEFTCSVLLPLRGKDELRIASLSPREQDVLRLLCQGWNFQAIGQRLGIQKETVERHQREIRAKLREPYEPETAYALEASVLAYLSGFFSPLTDLCDTED